MSCFNLPNQIISVSSCHFTSNRSHLIFIVILAVLYPAIAKPSNQPSIPLTYPTPPPIASQHSSETTPTETLKSNSTNDHNTFIIDNLRSLRSVLINCWSGTFDGGKNNASTNGIDKSFKSWNKEFIEEFKNCLKIRTLNAMERAIKTDSIEVVPGWMNLVRYQREDEDYPSGLFREGKSAGRQLFNWRILLFRRILRLLRNHHLEINLNPHRHDMEGRRRHHFMPMLVFGAITSSIIAIPMMFQFLSVLGGKALLLAKLALILTAIQGLKKVAQSNFNYGLYNTPGYNPWQQYDRKYYFDMNMDYTPPGVGPGNPYAEHLDRLNNVGDSAVANIPERNYIPDYQQVLRPRSTIVNNVEE